jgi:hypothetical protein
VATLHVETMVNAPASRCFDLSRSVDLHIKTASASGETAIAGTMSGLLGLGDQVTWRGKHFGIWQTLTSRITIFDRPRHFRDSQVAGTFASLETRSSVRVGREHDEDDRRIQVFGASRAAGPGG